MDPIKKREITLPKIIEFTKKNNIGLIIISHDMNDLKLADHIILLETGEIVCQGDFNVLSNNEKFKKMINV
jgi:ABC-type transport system involved in cytochrome bd biosynthesis fused ATPase/permease subunit